MQSAETGSWVKVPAVPGATYGGEPVASSQAGLMDSRAAERPVVVGLGTVDPTLVTGVLGPDVDFVPTPTDADLAVAQGAIVRADAVVDAAFLDRTPGMRVLARTGVGTDLVDLKTATARGIAVVVTPGSGTRAVAEGVLAHAMALAKRLGPYTTLIREGRWAERTAGGPPGDLDGATIGIIGFGRIGRRVGELAAAFGMRVLAYDPFAAPPPELECRDLDALVAAGDVLTLHVPLTAENHHMVDAAFLGRPSRARCSSTAVAAACSTSTRLTRRSSPGSSRGSASTCSSPNRPRTTRSSTTRT